MRYIWDPAKAALNLAKHGVAFGEAISAFDDPNGLYLPDPGHPERGNLIGYDAKERVLFVVHIKLLTEAPPATRLISARHANARQRALYQAQFAYAPKGRSRRRSKTQKVQESTDRPLPPKKKRRYRHEED